MFESILQYLNTFFNPEVFVTYLLSALGCLSAAYFSYGTISNFKIIKKNKNKKIKVFPTEIIKECKELENLEHTKIKDQYKEYLIEFCNKLKDNVDNNLLGNLENNLKDLKINKGKINPVYGGHYEPSNNKIVIVFPNKKTIFHELLHMASSHRESNKLFTGFHQYSYDVDIGNGFNEGYTELLNQRIFKSKKISGIYQYFVNVTRVIEEVIDKENMMEDYFTSNLRALCSHMHKYISDEDIEQLLSDTDYLFDCFTEPLQSGLTIPYNQAKFNNVNRILTNMYTNKLKMNNEYTEKNINKYKNILPRFYQSTIGSYFIKTNFEKEQNKNNEQEQGRVM